ncbi:MAG: hypothetical protein M1480_17785 [Bacteroidetes bacterium]|nr:hypothetical protein [Bacteroidota bacterium]
MRPIQKIIFFSTIFIFILIFILFELLRIKPIISYTSAYISSSLVFLFLCWQILKSDIPKKYITALIALGICLRIIFSFLHPIGSDDYYRYLWDGKVQANGINPYRYAPADTALNNLHSTSLPKLVNFPEMKTIYPPLSQMIFYFSYLIGGESYLGLKFLLLVFDLFTLLGISLIIKKLNLPTKNILLYALCTLPLFQFFIDAHVDGFGLTFLIFAIFFYIDKKKLLSLIFLSASICVKPLGLILIPIFFFQEKNWKDKFLVIAIPILICTIAYLPYIFTGSPFQALMQFTENWMFNGIVFDILDSFIKNNQLTRAICGILLMIVYLSVILGRKDFLTKLFLSLFFVYIFSPVVHPWYLSWLAVLIPFIPRWSGIAFVSLISLTAFTVLNYQLNGVWKEYTLVLLFEYTPVLFLISYEWLKNKDLVQKNII